MPGCSPRTDGRSMRAFNVPMTKAWEPVALRWEEGGPGVICGGCECCAAATREAVNIPARCAAGTLFVDAQRRETSAPRAGHLQIARIIHRAQKLEGYAVDGELSRKRALQESERGAPGIEGERKRRVVQRETNALPVHAGRGRETAASAHGCIGAPGAGRRRLRRIAMHGGHENFVPGSQ